MGPTTSVTLGPVWVDTAKTDQNRRPEGHTGRQPRPRRGRRQADPDHRRPRRRGPEAARQHPPQTPPPTQERTRRGLTQDTDRPRTPGRGRRADRHDRNSRSTAQHTTRQQQLRSGPTGHEPRYRIDTNRGPVTATDHPCSGTSPHHRRPSGAVHLISGIPKATGPP